VIALLLFKKAFFELAYFKNIDLKNYSKYLESWGSTSS